MHKFLFLTLFTFLFSQAEISNIQASQRTDGSQIVDITYDLIPDDYFEIFEVVVQVSLDNGNTFSSVLFLDGDVGAGIIPGDSKIIEWNIGSQYPNQYSDDLIIKIIATSTFTESYPFNMVEIDTGFVGCNIGNEVNYNYKIMERNVTYAQYAEFLIEMYNDGLIEISIDDIYGYYGGDQYLPEGYYKFFDYWYGFYDNSDSALSWNGTTFIVEEGRGNDPIWEVSWVGATAFAQHYGMRIPTVNERSKAEPYVNLDYNSGCCGDRLEWISDFTEVLDPNICNGCCDDGFFGGSCTVNSVLFECSLQSKSLSEQAHFRCVGN